MKVEVVKITPAMAEEMLKKNTHNRALREKQVERMARAMSRGEWVLNGEAIKFSKNDTVDDGQHRLHAIVRSGCTVETVVVRDLSEGAQDTMDTGVRRKFSDVLKLRGELDSQSLAAIVKTAWHYANNDIAKSVVPSNQELLKFLEKNSGLRNAVDVAKAMRHAVIGPISIYGAFAHIVSNIDADDAEFFINRFIDGEGLDANSPILHLRNYMAKISTSRERPPINIMFAHMLKAWNLHRDGIKVRVLSYKSGGKTPEAFPWAR